MHTDLVFASGVFPTGVDLRQPSLCLRLRASYVLYILFNSSIPFCSGTAVTLLPIYPLRLGLFNLVSRRDPPAPGVVSANLPSTEVLLYGGDSGVTELGKWAAKIGSFDRGIFYLPG